MLHPSIQIQWINAEKGYGLFSTDFLPKGTITWALDGMDRIYYAKHIAKLEKHYQQQIYKYGYRNAKGNYIICWDLAKYMNHSCKPNTLSPGLKFDVAIEDIHPGDEVTTDYSSLNLEETLNCSCGHAGCRKKIQDKDFDIFMDHWDGLIQVAFQDIDKVNQALWPWVEEQRLLKQIKKPGGKVPSIIKHRFKQSADEFSVDLAI